MEYPSKIAKDETAISWTVVEWIYKEENKCRCKLQKSRDSSLRHFRFNGKFYIINKVWGLLWFDNNHIRVFVNN